MAQATFIFDPKNNAKKYTYQFDYPGDPTKENLAWAIAKGAEKTEKKKKTKVIGVPRYYNLVLKLLNQDTHIHCPSGSIDVKKLQFIDANNRNMEEKGIWNEKEQCYERLMWRVGISQSHTLIIDVDGRDITNAKRVKEFYENILKCKFTLIKSNKGYWLISDKKYKSVNEWKYDHCRILNPKLDQLGADDYIKSLLSLDKDKDGKFVKSSTERIKESGLYFGHGDFDLMFTFLSIKRELSTLRISKKRKTDSIEVIT